MAFDEGLAQRIRDITNSEIGFDEKFMFGGVGFLLNGNMACGVHKDYLIVRIGPDNNEESLAKPNTKPFDITGRPMKGWIMINEDGYESDSDLQSWVAKGISFAKTLPAK